MSNKEEKYIIYHTVHTFAIENKSWRSNNRDLTPFDIEVRGYKIVKTKASKICCSL